MANSFALLFPVPPRLSGFAALPTVDRFTCVWVKAGDESRVRRTTSRARVLDIGCGSGHLAAAIMAKRPDVRIDGVDVLVDVLHHTDDPAAVLAEASRVAAQGVLVKDHYQDGPVAGMILKFMDFIGNASHGVRLPYNYLARKQWQAIWRRLGLVPKQLGENLGIYPMSFDLVFGRDLHFVALLDKESG